MSGPRVLQFTGIMDRRKWMYYKARSGEFVESGPYVASVTIDEATFEVAVDATVPLTGTVLDQHGDPMTGEVLEWTSSDENIATVDSDGVVTGVAEGVVTITARNFLYSATSEGTVTA